MEQQIESFVFTLPLEEAVHHGLKEVADTIAAATGIDVDQPLVYSDGRELTVVFNRAPSSLIASRLVERFSNARALYYCDQEDAGTTFEVSPSLCQSSPILKDCLFKETPHQFLGGELAIAIVESGRIIRNRFGKNPSDAEVTQLLHVFRKYLLGHYEDRGGTTDQEG